MHRIGGAFRVSFGPFSGVFLAHTTGMNLQIRRKMTTNNPPKSIHHSCASGSQPGSNGKLGWGPRGLQRNALYRDQFSIQFWMI